MISVGRAFREGWRLQSGHYGGDTVQHAGTGWAGGGFEKEDRTEDQETRASQGTLEPCRTRRTQLGPSRRVGALGTYCLIYCHSVYNMQRRPHHLPTLKASVASHEAYSNIQTLTVVNKPFRAGPVTSPSSAPLQPHRLSSCSPKHGFALAVPSAWNAIPQTLRMLAPHL